MLSKEVVRKIRGSEADETKKKNLAQIKEISQTGIEMKTPPSSRLNIKDNAVKYTWLGAEVSRMPTLPKTHHLDTESVDHHQSRLLHSLQWCCLLFT